MSSPEAPTAPSRTIYDVQRDLDLDELLETVVSPPSCEYSTAARPGDLCGKPATWIFALSCGHSAYLDDEHAGTIRKWLEWSESQPDPRIACRRADQAPAHPFDLGVTVTTFERIAS